MTTYWQAAWPVDVLTVTSAHEGILVPSELNVTVPPSGMGVILEVKVVLWPSVSEVLELVSSWEVAALFTTTPIDEDETK